MEKKYFLFLIFISFLIVYNISFLNIENLNDPYYIYMENQTITNIYTMAIILNILTFFSVFILMFESKIVLLNKFAIVILFISNLLIFILIVYELYYGSIFYYGEVRDKQGLPIGVNNLGFLGSTIYMSLTLSLVYFKKPILIKHRMWILFIFILLAILLQLIFFKLFETSWNMSGS